MVFVQAPSYSGLCCTDRGLYDKYLDAYGRWVTFVGDGRAGVQPSGTGVDGAGVARLEYRCARELDGCGDDGQVAGTAASGLEGVRFGSVVLPAGSSVTVSCGEKRVEILVEGSSVFDGSGGELVPSVVGRNRGGGVALCSLSDSCEVPAGVCVPGGAGCGGGRRRGVGAVDVTAGGKSAGVAQVESVESSGRLAGSVELPTVEVSERTLRNRERRREHKERKERKKVLQSAGIRSRYASVDGEFVPEWRRQSGGSVVGSAVGGLRGKGFFAESSDEQRRLLRESRANMLAAQNDLNTFRAKQQLELERAKDINQLKKRQETLIMRQTEVNKVQVEKAFASLARAGNVPGAVGCAETVVSGSGSGVSPVFSGVGSGSVSPNSSVSLAEIHALQKEHLSQKKDIGEMQRQLNHLKFLDPEMYKKIGGGFERAPTVNTGYTVDSQGQPIGDPPDSHWGGEIQADGKYHYVTEEPFHLYDY